MLNMRSALLAAAAAVLISLAPVTAASAVGHGGDRWGDGESRQGQGWHEGHDDRADRGDWGERRDRDDHRSHRDRDHDRDRDRGKTHVCKRGGYEDLVRAETGVGFESQGECLRHDALGGAYSSLSIDLETMYACGSDESESCWGLVDGMNLQPSSLVLVEWNSTEGDQSDDFTRLVADQSGGLAGFLNFQCDESNNVITGLTATGTTSAGASVTSDPVTIPCNANVVG